MLKSVFVPNKTNSYAWVNILFIILLLVIGKIEPYAILFGYFIETIVIGFFNVLKMYVTYKHNDSKAPIIANILFFIAHYGGFVAIQSVFVFAIFSFGDSAIINEPFNLIVNYKMVLSLEGIKYFLPILIGSQLMKYVFDFIQPKKYMKFKVKDIMFKPYFRIVIQQFTVIIASFFMIFSGGSVLAATLLILLRFIVDFLFVAIKEESQFLDYLVDKLDDGKQSKEQLRKQLLAITE
jgi:hypothetical protein